jgi:prevent-host-death family protein
MSESTTVDVHEAKIQLLELLRQVERGVEVVITQAGHPVARLSGYTPRVKKIAAPGGMEGKGYWIAADFDSPVNELFDALPD